MQRLRTEETTDLPPGQYESDAVREVLARAVVIEQNAKAAERADALSAAQVEALGRELGIAPEAIRQALRERRATAAAITGALTRKQIKAAITPALWYIPLIGLFFNWYFGAARSGHLSRSWDALAIGLAFFAAPLIAAIYGWRTRDYRQGLLAGAVVNALSAALFFALLVLRIGPPSVDSRVDELLMTSAFAGTFLGAMGGVLSRWWHSLGDTDDR